MKYYTTSCYQIKIHRRSRPRLTATVKSCIGSVLESKIKKRKPIKNPYLLRHLQHHHVLLLLCFEPLECYAIHASPSSPQQFPSNIFPQMPALFFQRLRFLQSSSLQNSLQDHRALIRRRPPLALHPSPNVAFPWIRRFRQRR